MVFLSNYLVFKIVLAALGRVDYPVAGDLELKYDTANKIYLSGGSLKYVDDVTLHTTIGDETTGYDIQFNSLNLDASNEQILFASDAATNHYFGSDTAISGNYAIVGAFDEDVSGGTDSGAAYIFYKSGTTWLQQAKLKASDPATSDKFGHRVDIEGDYAIVGAYNKNSNTGAAYIFKRSGTTWTQQSKLTASNAGASDEFGRAVGISGDYAFVGARREDTGGTDRGSVYIYVRSGTTWTQHAQIQSSDAQDSDNFGWALSVDGDYAVIGAYLEDTGGTDAGSAYIFYKSGTTWSQQAKIQSSDIQAGDSFGASVSISGDYLVVGAQDEDTGGSSAGSAYVFVRSGTSWTQQAILRASDAQASDSFSAYDPAVSISGNHVVVGAFGEDAGGSNAGAAYVFSRSGSTWTEVKKIVASNPTASDFFGQTVAIDGANVIMGAREEDTKASAAGAAYIYSSQQVTNYYITDAGKYSVDATIAGLNYKTNEVEVTSLNPGNAVYTNDLKETSEIDHGTSTSKLKACSVSLDGTRVALGATDGRVKVYHLETGVWTLKKEYTKTNNFGAQVCLNDAGTRLFVSDPIDTSGTGKVYVYDYSGSAWGSSETHSWTSPNGSTSDNFGGIAGKGISCNSAGTRLLVVNGYTGSKKGYIFDHNGTNWNAAPTKSWSSGSSWWGITCALNDTGDRAFIGYQNGVDIFHYDGSNWPTSATKTYTGSDYFGASLTINGAGTRLLVSSYNYSSSGGKTDLYDYVGGSWNTSATQTINVPYGSSQLYGHGINMSRDGKRYLVAAHNSSTYFSAGGQVDMMEDTTGSGSFTLKQIFKPDQANENMGSYQFHEGICLDQKGYTAVILSTGTDVSRIYSSNPIPTLDFDNYNKLSIGNAPTNTSSKLVLGSNVYDIGSLTSDLTIETPGLYRGLVFDTSSNVAYFNKTTVGSITTPLNTHGTFVQSWGGNFWTTTKDLGVNTTSMSFGGWVDLKNTNRAISINDDSNPLNDSETKDWHLYIENHSNSDHEFSMRHKGDNTVFSFRANTSGEESFPIAKHKDGALTHFVVTTELVNVLSDGSGTYYVSLYSNGQLIKKKTWSISSPQNDANAVFNVKNFRIGKHDYEGNNNGSFSRMFLYSGTLSDSDVNKIYHNYVPKSTGNCVLKCYFPFKNGLNDESGNNNHLVEVGTTNPWPSYTITPEKGVYPGFFNIQGYSNMVYTLYYDNKLYEITVAGVEQASTTSESHYHPAQVLDPKRAFVVGTGGWKSQNGASLPAYFTVKLPEAKYISNMFIRERESNGGISGSSGTGSTAPREIIIAWEIEASTDGTTWSSKHSDTGIGNSGKDFELDTPGTFQYWRIKVSSAQNYYSGNTFFGIFYWDIVARNFTRDGPHVTTLAKVYYDLKSAPTTVGNTPNTTTGITYTNNGAVHDTSSSSLNFSWTSDNADVFSVSFLAKNLGSSQSYFVRSTGNSSAPEFEAYLAGSTNIWARSRNDSLDQAYFRVDTSDWTHYVYVHSPVFRGLYINGALVSRRFSTLSGTSGQTSFYSSTSNMFNAGGVLSEFRAFSNVLDQHQIQELYDYDMPDIPIQPDPITFDGYNKLSLSGITNPTSKIHVLPTGAESTTTYDIGTATNMYIESAGTYTAEMKGSDGFALDSNVVGTVNAREELPPLISWTNLGTTLASDNGGAYTFTASGSNYSQVSGSGNNYITNTGNEYLYIDFSPLRSSDKPFRVDYEIYGSAWNYGLNFGQIIGSAGNSNWDTQNNSVGLYGDLSLHIPNGGVVSTGVTVSTYGSTTWVKVSFRREANGNTVKLYINDTYISEITPTPSTHPLGFEDPVSQISLFKHEWYSTPTQYTASGTRIRNIKVWDVTDTQLPKLTFDGFNKYTFTGADTDSTYKLKYFSNTYDLGTVSTAYIKDAGTYSAEIKGATNFALSSNVATIQTVTQPTLVSSISITASSAGWGSYTYEHQSTNTSSTYYEYKISADPTNSAYFIAYNWTTNKWYDTNPGTTHSTFGTSASDTSSTSRETTENPTVVYVMASNSLHAQFINPYFLGPSLDFDGYNKLTFSGLDSGSTSNVTFDGNTYSIGTATNIYISEQGTYEAESKGTTTFALTRKAATVDTTITEFAFHYEAFNSSYYSGKYSSASAAATAGVVYSDTATSTTYSWGTLNSVDTSTSGQVGYSLTLSSAMTANVLIVGGGGGGGAGVSGNWPSAGGGGKVQNLSDQTISAGTYTIVVGNGGTAASGGGGGAGTTSSAFGTSAAGGGAGSVGTSGTSGSGNGPGSNSGANMAGGGGDAASGGNASSNKGGSGGDGSNVSWLDGSVYGEQVSGQAYFGGGGFGGDSGGPVAGKGNGVPGTGGGGNYSGAGKSGIVAIRSGPSSNLPSLTHDGYKLVVKNITPTSTSLRLGSNTYEIGSATNIYVENTGDYTAEIGNATDFVLTSNTVSGTIKTIEPGFASRYQGSTALTYDGKLYAWGMNDDGEAGVGTSSDITVPTLCTGITQGTVAKLLSGSDITDNSRGEVSAIKTTDGKIYMAGKGDNNCIPGKTSDQTSFTDVTSYFGDQSLTANTVTMMSFTDASGAALTETGNVWTWGTHDSTNKRLGQAGASTSSTPKQINFSSATGTITKITCGHYHTVALDSSGDVWFWGINGINSTSWPSSITDEPQKVVDGKNIIGLASSYGNMYAWDATGKMWNAGNNYEGQIGDGTTTASSTGKTLTEVTYFSSKGITINKVYGGGYFTFADTSDGYYCWGNGGNGVFGNGSTGNITSGPAKWTNVTNIKKFMASTQHTTAITEDGKYYAWGRDYHGGRGDSDSASDISYPKYIDALPNILAPSFDFDGYDKVFVNKPYEIQIWCVLAQVKSGSSLDGLEFTGITPSKIYIPYQNDWYTISSSGMNVQWNANGTEDGYPLNINEHVATIYVNENISNLTGLEVKYSSSQTQNRVLGLKFIINGVTISEETTKQTADSNYKTSYSFTPSTFSPITKYTKGTTTYDVGSSQIVTVPDPGTYDAQLSQGGVFSLKSATVPATSSTGLYTWAFHHGNFDNAYGDGDILTARDNGRFYADTPAYTGDIGTITPGATTTSNTTYTFAPPSGGLTANVLMVAGGGGGGPTSGGSSAGGGAGGLVYTAGTTLSGTKTIVVGNGGANHINGNDTTFTLLTTTVGGGRGATAGETGGNGGSGGGTSHHYPTSPGTGESDQGNAGGNAGNNTYRNGGGGGGAGGVGGNASTSSQLGGVGGIGLNYSSTFGSFYGESGWFAGGGAGCSNQTATPAVGGIGGGGYSSTEVSTENALSGQSHTGGGGGGAGGKGGSGIVLLQTNVATPNVNSEVKIPEPHCHVFIQNSDDTHFSHLPSLGNNNVHTGGSIVPNIPRADGSVSNVYYASSTGYFLAAQAGSLVSTVEGIFYPIEQERYDNILEIGHNSTHDVELEMASDGTAKLYRNNGGTHLATSTVKCFTAGKWHHIALTLDANRNAVGYVNGYPVVSATYASAKLPLTREQMCLYRTGVTATFRKFLMYYFKTYNSVLNQNQILKLASSVGLGPKLEYDGLNTIKILNTEPGSSVKLFTSNVADTSNVFIVADPAAGEYTVPEAGKYYAEIKGTDTFTITKTLDVSGTFPLYQYPPYDGTTSSLTQSASADTWNTWTISGASNGNGQYQAKTTHAPHSSGFSAYRAFDNNIDDGTGQMASTTMVNFGITLQLPSAKTIRKYRMYPVDHTMSGAQPPGSSTDPMLGGTGNEDYQSRPNSWVLKGSNDGTSWTDLDTVTNKPISIYGDVYSIDSPASYQYYQMFIVNTVNTASTILRVGEWQLWGDA